MPIKDLLWELVLVGMILAYALSFLGVRAAKRHDVAVHGKGMRVVCGPVGLWLVAYFTKQMLVGRDQFLGLSSNIGRCIFTFLPCITA